MAAPELAISLAYLELLLAKIRAIQGKEGEVVPDPGSNATDDGMTDTLQEHARDPQRAEVKAEIVGMGERQRAELVALLWIGRGDAEPDDWQATVAMARERATMPTEDYLLDDPLAAEDIAEGLERLGIAMPSAIEARH